MPIRPRPRFSWFVPIDGDGPQLGTATPAIPPTFEHLHGVAQAAEAAGYHSLLIPTRFANGSFAPEADLAETWTTATALLARTERIRLLVAVRPGFIAPPLFAHMSSTLAEQSGGRLDLNVVPGGIKGEFERYGVHLDHDQRYDYAEEFVEASTRLWEATNPVTMRGRHVRFADVQPPRKPSQTPQWYFGGASDAALGLAARQGDVLLAWIQPEDETRSLLERARVAFGRAGRTARFGLRSHVVIGSTEVDAWERASRVIAAADSAVLSARRGVVDTAVSQGAAAQAQAVVDHRLTERLWNGISTVRVNCGTAIVGTAAQVAAELAAFHALGFDEFILSGFPHDDQATAVAEHVLPIARELMA